MDVSDIVLNFSDLNNSFEFFEWERDDCLFYIDKILAFKIDSKFFDDFNNYYIKVDRDFLKIIKNETITDRGIIKYACLVGDGNRVVALEFASSGNIIKTSSLLLDEEDIIIEEMSDLDSYSINYSLITKRDIFPFLTRNEKKIRMYLVNEINYLYKNYYYDLIGYLYFEMFNTKASINYMYKKLISDITNNFNDDFLKLYEIVKMV